MKSNRIIAYLRVSTDRQDLQTQKLTLLEYARYLGVTIDKFIEIEISSRKSPKARRVDELIELLKPEDLLLVSEISRLGRSVGQILRIINHLTKKRVRLIAIKEGLRFDGNPTIETKIMTTIIGLFAEIERDLVSQRTKAGLKAARKRGRRLGRPPGPGKSKLDPHRAEIENLIKLRVPKTRIARKYGTTAANLHRWLKIHRIA